MKSRSSLVLLVSVLAVGGTVAAQRGGRTAPRAPAAAPTAPAVALPTSVPTTTPPANTQRVRVLHLSASHAGSTLAVLDPADHPLATVAFGAAAAADLTELSGLAVQENGRNILFQSIDEYVGGRVDTLVLFDDADGTNVSTRFVHGRDFGEPSGATGMHVSIGTTSSPVTFCVHPATGPSVGLAMEYSTPMASFATTIPTGAVTLEVRAPGVGADSCIGALKASVATTIGAGYRGLFIHQPTANGAGDVILCDQDAPYACHRLALVAR